MIRRLRKGEFSPHRSVFMRSSVLYSTSQHPRASAIKLSRSKGAARPGNLPADEKDLLFDGNWC